MFTPRLGLLVIPFFGFGPLPGPGTTAAEPAPARPARASNLGGRIEPFTLRDVDGTPRPLPGTKGRSAHVVVFLSLECPVSTSYSRPLTRLADAYLKRGVDVVGVVPGADAAAVRSFVAEYKLGFPVLPDPDTRAAAAFAARVTPEAFVLDTEFVVRYRGRVDDSYSERLKLNARISRHDLREALDQILAGKPVTVAETRAVGCPVWFAPTAPTTAGVNPAAVTYHRDVLPILQTHCQGCHRPGEVGPFSLLTYKQAVLWAADIKEFTRTRAMPPWKPVKGQPFHDERRLTDAQIKTLAAWVDGGTPEGAVADAPPARAFTDGWQLGTPDLVLTPSDEFRLDASGRDVFRCFVMPTNLPADTSVVGVEVRPGNPRVVHHTLLFLDTTGQARKLEREFQDKERALPAAAKPDSGAGYSVAMGVGFRPAGGMSGWAPGQMPRLLPAGAGYPLPKGADVVAQIHYHRNGRPESDRTRIGLYLAKTPVKTRYLGVVMRGQFLYIPANQPRTQVEAAYTVLDDCTLYSVMPHMHMLGRKIVVRLTPPNDTTKTLLAITDWDYNWQETYYFKTPLRVRAGSRLELEAVYDNSAGNPRNPSDPPRLVAWGEQTTDEMCFVFLGATADADRIRLRSR